MADVRSFPGLRYNPAEVGDLGRVVAPPYDVIRDEELDEFRARSPFNVVRLTRPGDDYEAAAALLRDWIEQGVLADDSSPRM